MDGLGFGIIKKDGITYYQCNYKGFPFQLVAPAKEYTLVTYMYTKPAIIGEDAENEGAPIFSTDPENMTTVEGKKYVYVNEAQTITTILNYFNNYIKESNEYLAWCTKTFANKTPQLVEEAIRADLDGNPTGKQWDYENNVYIYEDEDVFSKRCMVWADANLTDTQVNWIIATRGYDIRATEKKEKVREIIEKYGPNQGFFTAAKATPDGKIVLDK